MTTSLYNVTIPVFIKGLENMAIFFDKTLIHAENKKFDVNTLLTSRLSPDQFPFAKQIQLASDAAKAFPARLKGEDPVSMPDTETTIEELRERLLKTVAVLKEIKPEDIDGNEDTQVRIKWFPGKYITGFSYATEYALPNFFFHMTTAYAILRHNGVDLGKSDYLGALSLEDDA
ncbi:MAG: hypothetical protein JWN64_89 [Parcubacteria group bacterium]|nr:hypothetical protein [Parcubacteria group bacterium]